MGPSHLSLGIVYLGWAHSGMRTVVTELAIGTTTGDLCVFDIRSQIFRASVPVSSGGLKAMAQHGEYVFIGSGDGSLKKVYDRMDPSMPHPRHERAAAAGGGDGL